MDIIGVDLGHGTVHKMRPPQRLRDLIRDKG